jgi:hypothetical protein
MSLKDATSIKKSSAAYVWLLPNEMHSPRDFGKMIADPERFGAYAKTISRVGRPGDTVAEIGCGRRVLPVSLSGGRAARFRIVNRPSGVLQPFGRRASHDTERGLLRPIPH